MQFLSPDSFQATTIGIFIFAFIMLIIYFGGLAIIKAINKRSEREAEQTPSKGASVQIQKQDKSNGLRRILRRRNRMNRRDARQSARASNVITAGPYHG